MKKLLIIIFLFAINCVGLPEYYQENFDYIPTSKLDIIIKIPEKVKMNYDNKFIIHNNSDYEIMLKRLARVWKYHIQKKLENQWVNYSINSSILKRRTILKSGKTIEFYPIDRFKEVGIFRILLFIWVDKKQKVYNNSSKLTKQKIYSEEFTVIKELGGK